MSDNNGLAVDVQGETKSYICLACEKVGRTARFETTIAGARHINRSHNPNGAGSQSAGPAESFAPAVIDSVPRTLETRRAILWALPPASKLAIAVVIAVGGFVAYALASAGSSTPAMAAFVATAILAIVAVLIGLRGALRPLWLLSVDPKNKTAVIRQRWARAAAVKQLDPRTFYTVRGKSVAVIDFRHGTAQSAEVHRGKPRVPATSLFFFLDQSATQRIAAGSAKLLSPENVQAGIAILALALLFIAIVWASGHGAAN